MRETNMNERAIRRGVCALGLAVVLATTAMACGSSGGSDGEGKPDTGSPTAGDATGSSGGGSSGGGQAAATSVDDVCPLLDTAAIKAVYGGEDAKTNVVESMTPKTAKNCSVVVSQPVKVMKVGPDEIVTSVDLSLHAVAVSEQDFESGRPTTAEDVKPATKKAYWENDQYNRHIVWFSDGVRYELVFLTPGDAVDKAKGFATMQALAKDVMAKT